MTMELVSNDTEQKEVDDYQRDSFKIHVEKRGNGWGFRIQSTEYFCLLCFGGFTNKFDSLEFADELIQLITDNVE
jgi:hypothetical protein